ncbi:MAG: hypothetical protein Kow0047_20420 [Anaerolineae bacterium]
MEGLLRSLVAGMGAVDASVDAVGVWAVRRLLLDADAFRACAFVVLFLWTFSYLFVRINRCRETIRRYFAARSPSVKEEPSAYALSRGCAGAGVRLILYMAALLLLCGKLLYWVGLALR